MSVSPDSARKSLDEIRIVMGDTRAALLAHGAAEILMLWGFLWAAAFGATFVWPPNAGWVWLACDAVGVLGTILIATGVGRPRPVRSDTLRREGWRVFWFWCALSAYAWLWLAILRPANGLQLNAFITTVVMLAFLVMGLWFEWLLLTVLGTVITLFVVAGYWLWPAYYALWMAVAGGGALFGTGFYLRLRWR